MASSPALGNLGFLTILHDNTGYLGGYLVTNQWGRPLEFRLSTPVQPNRVHHILYGDTLEPYICGDLIGKTLLEKTSSQANVIITDHRRALDLRLRVDVPIVWLGHATKQADDPLTFKNFRCHPRFPEDAKALRAVMNQTGGVVDLAEPFTRVREAIAEARKMGVAGRG